MSIKCPKCKHPKSDVFDSRPREDGIHRRRTCQKCEHRFSTQERVFVSAKVSPTPKRTKPPSRPVKRRLTATPPKRKEPDFDSMTDEQLEDYIYSKDRPFDFIDDDELF